ncbi:lamin tail domain-containing protein [Wukongibacter sp. M2B1]|uniref:lamin tail domain-containing protein n=1 Tax=Wukongibacter sp. M2B1 TaxID=3088895 RepID=UPI003D7A350D
MLIYKEYIKMVRIKELFNKKKAVAFVVMLTSFFMFGCSKSELTQEQEVLPNNIFEGYKLIQVDGGDLSGHREANVVVDIGYGDREYWAFTNEYGQLVKVIAKKITLQDEANEPVLSTGRYYRDEAKVPGVESDSLDEGHVIADSLGGVSNAYNITPQNSTLNRHGDQAYMEKVIRDAGGCTDFVAIITYPSNNTQIPSHYSFTYIIKGNTVNDEFDNINPDEANAKLETEAPTEKQTGSMDKKVMITELDKKAEYITLKNSSNDSVDLTGWKIVSVKGNQSFTFPKFTLNPNATVKVGDSAKNTDIDFHWMDGKGTWNNSKSDPAELYNTKGELVDKYDD